MIMTGSTPIADELLEQLREAVAEVPERTLNAIIQDEIEPDESWVVQRSEGRWIHCCYLGHLRALARAAKLMREVLGVTDE